jgi:hypothetical protein
MTSPAAAATPQARIHAALCIGVKKINRYEEILNQVDFLGR